MKLITWNINGIRSAEKDGNLTKLIEEQNPDILCLQETKINECFSKNYGYNIYYNFAEKKGYSGVAILTKKKPIKIESSLGSAIFDREGRYIMAEYEDFIVIDIYIPHGGRQKENHPYKFNAIELLLKKIKELDKPVYICTDFNIAHTIKDVKNYKTNKNNNMFTPQERAYIDKLLSQGLVDTFRVLHDDTDVYSMWPNSFNARARNMGWRIDYIFASSSIKQEIKKCEYLKGHLGSDHCPYLLELKKNKKVFN